MDPRSAPIDPHPAGEPANPSQYPAGAWPIDTPGGRVYAEWDDHAPVTREGQLIFFFQFLRLGGWTRARRVILVRENPARAPVREAGKPRRGKDRADAENCFDELKNQWGWGGFTSKRLAPSRLMANLIALFYNWWHLYLRFYDEAHHREAIRSRPMLMHGVGRQVQSGITGDDQAVVVTLPTDSPARFFRLSVRVE